MCKISKQTLSDLNLLYEHRNNISISKKFDLDEVARGLVVFDAYLEEYREDCYCLWVSMLIKQKYGIMNSRIDLDGDEMLDNPFYKEVLLPIIILKELE